MSRQSRKAGPIRLRRIALAQMKAAMRSQAILKWYGSELHWLDDGSELKQWYLPTDAADSFLYAVRGRFVPGPAPMAIIYKDV